MTFATPFGYLESVYIGLIVLLYLIYFWVSRYKTRSLLWGRSVFLAKMSLRMVYMSLICVCMLAPSVKTEVQKVNISEKSIFCVVDVSKSMDANDLQPSRLQKAQSVLQDLVETQKGNKIGLIVFASEAFVQCPLTSDINLLKDVFLPSLNSNIVYSGGTDVGVALDLAIEKMLLEPQKPQTVSGKVILLFSDGEDFGKLDNRIFTKIKDNQIQLFVVGVGTARGGKIPTPNGYKRTQEGEEVLTKLNIAYLSNLAQQSNGKYWEINDQINPTQPIASTLAELKGTIKTTDVQNLSANQYFYFLFLAFLLALFDMFWIAKLVKI